MTNWSRKCCDLEKDFGRRRLNDLLIAQKVVNLSSLQVAPRPDCCLTTALLFGSKICNWAKPTSTPSSAEGIFGWGRPSHLPSYAPVCSHVLIHGPKAASYTLLLPLPPSPEFPPCPCYPDEGAGSGVYALIIILSSPCKAFSTSSCICSRDAWTQFELEWQFFRVMPTSDYFTLADTLCFLLGHCLHITGYINFSLFQSRYSLMDRVTEYHSIMTYRWPKNGQRWPNS